MVSWNKVPKSSFSGGFPLKPSICITKTANDLWGLKSRFLASLFRCYSRFEVCRNAINRFLRWMDLNWQVFNNFDVRHPTGPSQGECLEKMHFLGYFFLTGWMFWSYRVKTPNLVQKGPDGPRVWADTSLTLLRPSNLEIMHFESKKKRAFYPPPP